MTNNTISIGCNHSSPREKTLLFTGDVLLSSDYWDTQPCTDRVIKYLSSIDLAVANLEAPLPSGTPIEKFGSNLSTTSETIATLDRIGFDSVSLANNHIRDYNSSGIQATQEKCAELGLSTFGVGTTRTDALTPLVREIGGCSIAIFALSEQEESIATSQRAGAGWIYEPRIYDRIETATSKFDVTLVVAHGGLEYIPLPPESWRSHLRFLAEVGADGIIAHHPHTPQGWEVYEETPIFYSLGNFLMYRSERPSTKWSYGVEMSIDQSGVNSIVPLFFSVDNGCVDIMGEEPEAQYDQYLNRSSAIIQNDEQYSEYWTETATRLYFGTGYRYQYYHRLKEFGSGPLSSMVSNPVLEFDRLSRGVWGEAARREKELAMLDQLQCRSHSDAIRTALKSRIDGTSSEEDLKREVNSLFGVSDGTLDQNLLERQWNRLAIIYRRINS